MPKKISNRVVAAVAVSVLGVCSVGAVTADAYTINTAGFEYQLTVEKVSDSRIALHFDVTENPGVVMLTFSFQYDSNCVLDEDAITSVNLPGTAYTAVNEETNLIFVSFFTSSFFSSDFSTTYYFDTTDSADSEHSFSAGIGYIGFADGTEYDLGANIVVDAAIETSGVTYSLGDIDNDGNISITDAYVIKVMAGYGDGSVTTLNNKYLTTLQKSYPDLVCAEAADVDVDGTAAGWSVCKCRRLRAGRCGHGWCHYRS